jgi:hypothetical protein
LNTNDFDASAVSTWDTWTAMRQADFYRNETRVIGGELGVVETGSRLAELTPYFDSGAFRPLPISRSYGLDEGPDAYTAVASSFAPEPTPLASRGIRHGYSRWLAVRAFAVSGFGFGTT